MIKVFGIRLGFATNSSSTHSLIITDDQGLEKVKNITHQILDGIFGWDDFVLADEHMKRLYMACQLRDRLRRDGLAPAYATEIAASWSSVPVHVLEQWSLDHQSTIELPHEYGELNKTPVSRSFFEGLLKAIVKNEYAVVLGGNDNEETKVETVRQLKEKYTPYRMSTILGNQYFDYREWLVCRYEENNYYWTIFSPVTGLKIRMRFDYTAKAGKSDNIIALVDDAATLPDTPELVDIKITDYCENGCEFCYQDSSPEGEHANFQLIYNVLAALSRLKVFEVALGGGEPLCHPDILKILKTCRYFGIVPNISTRGISWLDDIELAKMIFEYVGAIAVSCTRADDVINLLNAINRHYDKMDQKYGLLHMMGHNKIYIQIPLGATSYEELSKMIEILQNTQEYGRKLYIPVTFLGFKRQGRGEQFAKTENFHDYRKWITKIFEQLKRPYQNNFRVVNSPDGQLPGVGIYSLVSFGIDTSLAKEVKDYLEKSTLGLLYTTREGTHSMYIDLVEKRLGPSSFCEEEDYVKFDPETLDVTYDKLIKNYFSLFQDKAR